MLPSASAQLNERDKMRADLGESRPPLCGPRSAAVSSGGWAVACAALAHADPRSGIRGRRAQSLRAVPLAPMARQSRHSLRTEAIFEAALHGPCDQADTRVAPRTAASEKKLPPTAPRGPDPSVADTSASTAGGGGEEDGAEVAGEEDPVVDYVRSQRLLGWLASCLMFWMFSPFAAAPWTAPPSIR